MVDFDAVFNERKYHLTYLLITRLAVFDLSSVLEI